MNHANLIITRPDDWHLHLRDGALLAAVLPDTARQFARAIVMPNLKPPVTTVEQAHAYRARIVAALPKAATAPERMAGRASVASRASDSARGPRTRVPDVPPITPPIGEHARFEPLMTLYLTDVTKPQEIAAAKASGFVHAVKYYPAGATTNSENGVTDLQRVYPVISEMEKHDLPLLLHGEVTDSDVDVFDREAVFIERHLLPLARAFPTLRLVLEHVTTREGVAFVEHAGPNVAATITAHHLLWNRNAMFAGGLRPHAYCLPVLKREDHRAALVRAATSGNPKFFLGSDSAPHGKRTKEIACGCAGIYSAHSALELYAEAFEAAGALDRLEAFASFYGADFYRLPRNTGTVTLLRAPWIVPRELGFGDDVLVPMRAGETLAWKLAGP